MQTSPFNRLSVPAPWPGASSVVITEDDHLFSQLEAVLGMRLVREVTLTRPAACRLDERGVDANVVIIDSAMPHWRRELQATDAGGGGRQALVLTRYDESDEKVAAFEAGADDVVWRYAAPAEIRARLRALTRRARGPRFGSGEMFQTFDLGDFLFTPAIRKLASPMGQWTRLSESETRLLSVFLSSRQIWLTRAEIAEVMARDYAGEDPPAMDWPVRIHRLRLAAKRVDPRRTFIRSIRGKGYCLEARLPPPVSHFDRS